MRVGALSVRSAALAVIAWFVLAAPAALGGQETVVPGVSRFGTNGWIEYIPGNLPVIFSAPHGGELTPDELPERTRERCGSAGFATAKDDNTEELARTIVEAFYEKTGKYPHVIINRLHRNRMEANREIEVGACGDPGAERAWEEFHGFIEAAKASVLAEHGKGWYTDLHGHAHPVARLELGYNMNAERLRTPDAELDAAPDFEMSTSMRVFSEESELSFSALLRGPTALGTLFERAGYRAVPSQQDPAPAEGEPFFSGGYNTRAHGCVDGGQICGVQIEHPRPGVRNTEEERANYARALADVYTEFLAVNFGILLNGPGPGPGSGR